MDHVDLLVFGPHPDDIEIGLGATVAQHAALGFRVGLCDLTAGEMGSNGTVEQRLVEAEAARDVLGAVWRTNLRLPDRAIPASASVIRRTSHVLKYGCDRKASNCAWNCVPRSMFQATNRYCPRAGASVRR